MTKRILTKLTFAEIALIVASVFIFRGLWTLLDRYEVMYQGWALWLSLILGILVSIPAVRYIIKHE